jgi:hypothetical protein
MRDPCEIRESCARKIKETEVKSIGCVGSVPGVRHPFPISATLPIQFLSRRVLP